MKYEIIIKETAWYNLDIEADTEEEAEKKALKKVESGKLEADYFDKRDVWELKEAE